MLSKFINDFWRKLIDLRFSSTQKIFVATTIFTILTICIVGTKKAYADAQTCSMEQCSGTTNYCWNTQYNTEGLCLCNDWGQAYPDSGCEWDSSSGTCYCPLPNQEPPPYGVYSINGCNTYGSCCDVNNCYLGDNGN